MFLLSTVVVVAINLFFGCSLGKRPITSAPTEEGPYGCKRPTDVALNPNELEIATVDIGKFTLGKIDYKSSPELVQIITKASRDQLIEDYLICIAKNRGDVNTPEQVDYLRRFLSFMRSDPSPEQIMKWQQENPFPEENIKEKARLLLRNENRVRQLEPKELGSGMMELSELPYGVYFFTDSISIRSQEKIIIDRQPIGERQLKNDINLQIDIRDDFNGLVSGLSRDDIVVYLRCLGETQIVKYFTWTEIGRGYYEIGINDSKNWDLKYPCMLWVDGQGIYISLLAMKPQKIEPPPIANYNLFEIHKLLDGSIYVIGFTDSGVDEQKTKDNHPNSRWVTLYSDQWEKGSEIIAVRLSEIITVKPRRVIGNLNLIAWDIQLR
ncbi:MAG TPA: hypothetical protein VJZ24_00780 [Thermodesulfovibrionales bacterium]|nr:hypothetical protein [Thermodesulfovibrionales bacterium]